MRGPAERSAGLSLDRSERRTHARMVVHQLVRRDLGASACLHPCNTCREAPSASAVWPTRTARCRLEEARPSRSLWSSPSGRDWATGPRPRRRERARLRCDRGELFGRARLQIERATLIDAARRHFDELGYRNMTSRGGDGTLEWSEQSPFDVASWRPAGLARGGRSSPDAGRTSRPPASRSYPALRRGLCRGRPRVRQVDPYREHGWSA